jgi:uncharacterized membrane protein
MLFTTPLAFVLLLCLPLVLYIGWPRQRYRRTRDIASLVIRLTLVTLVVLALAGAQIVRSGDRLAVVFLVDASDSVGTTATEDALDQARETMRGMGDNDLAGVILFGADAQVARAISANRELGTIRAAPDTGNSNIAAALRLALALLPGDAAGRIVIFSDGQPTLGDAEAQAQLAAAGGVEISYVPLTREPAPDVRLTRFQAPERVSEGQQFDLTLSIETDEAVAARLDVFAGGELIASEDVTLRAGVNSRTLTLEGGSAGFRDFSATVTPAGADNFYQNNRLSTFSQVVGPARALLVGDSPEDTQYLAPALRESGLVVDETTPAGLPRTVSGLAEYESIILVNVPAPRITGQMSALDSYVRDLGGGLLVVGGPDTYGPGGYFQTPLEAALPVEMNLKDQQRLPQLTLAYLIDRSGSMADVGRDGVPHIELAKEAIIRSIALLQPTDRAAVASFDSQSYWVAVFQDVIDGVALGRQVGTLTPSGGTDILSGMRLVARDIVNEPAEVKHIILLTDGISSDSGLVDITRQLRAAGVTTSAVTIGDDGAGLRLMEAVASAGGGNSHVATDVASIPQIFAQETVLATRSYIFEQTFTPTLTARSPIMDGINALPPLRGYIGTTPKAAAQVILRADEPFRDPVLAAWQYGLGRSVAFTSDATARWGVDWVTWDNFARFWSQAVRWTITEGGDNNLETRIVMEDGRARIIVDARDDDGAFFNGLDLEASVVDPALGNQRARLRQVAPGRYEATFNPEAEGAYFLRLSGTGAGAAVNQTTGWVMGYSPEYLTRRDASVLPALAQLTGGRSMAGALSEAAFERNLEARSTGQPIWPLLLLLALLLLPLDVAVRRLLITPSDLRRLRDALTRRPAPVPATPSERMTGLFDARERAREVARTRAAESDAPPAPASTISALKSRRERDTTGAASGEAPSAPPSPGKKADAPAKPSAPAQPAEPPKPRYTPPADAGPSTGNIGSRLLQKRRERDDE